MSDDLWVDVPSRRTIKRMGTWGCMLPTIVGLVAVGPSIAWASLDRSIWPWDPSWYGAVSVDLWATLSEDVPRWAALMTHAFGQKPPGVAWLGQLFVPVGEVVGDVGVGLLLSVLACQALTVALVFATSRRLRCGTGAAVAGAAVVAGAPLFVSMSHEYFAEPVQTAAVAWALFVLASAPRWPWALVAAQIPGIVAVGMLAKLSSPPYLGATLAGAAVISLRGWRAGTQPGSRIGDRRVLASVATSAILVVGAASWYQVNYRAALDHARLASADTGLYGVDRGFGRQFVEWLDRLQDASFLPNFGLALLAVTLGAIALVIRRGVRPIWSAGAIALCVSAVTVVLVLALFATQPNEAIRYLLAVLPFVGVSLAVVLASARSRALVAIAILIVVAGFGLTTAQSFGVTSFASPKYVQIIEASAPSALSRELVHVVDQTCTAESADRINMVGADHPWFNANTLTAIAFERHALDGRRCYYTALGYAESDPEKAWRRVLEFQPPFFIGIDYGNSANPLPEAQRGLVRPSDPFNLVNRAVFERLEASDAWEFLPGSRNAGLVVYRARPPE